MYSLRVFSHTRPQLWNFMERAAIYGTSVEQISYQIAGVLPNKHWGTLLFLLFHSDMIEDLQFSIYFLFYGWIHKLVRYMYLINDNNNK